MWKMLVFVEEQKKVLFEPGGGAGDFCIVRWHLGMDPTVDPAHKYLHAQSPSTWRDGWETRLEAYESTKSQGPLCHDGHDVASWLEETFQKMHWRIHTWKIRHFQRIYLKIDDRIANTCWQLASHSGEHLNHSHNSMRWVLLNGDFDKLIHLPKFVYLKVHRIYHIKLVSQELS